MLATTASAQTTTTTCQGGLGSALCTTTPGPPSSGQLVNQAFRDAADTFIAARQADRARQQAARPTEEGLLAQQYRTRRYQVAKLIGEGDCASAKRLAAAYADLDILQQTISICGPLEAPQK